MSGDGKENDKEPLDPAAAADGSRPELVDAYRFARESGISLGFMPPRSMYKPSADPSVDRDSQADGE